MSIHVHLLHPSTVNSPTPYEYKSISDKILAVFPGVNIWYHEAQTKGRTHTAPYGKLFNKVKNVRDWMRKKYLLSTKKDSDDEDEEDTYEVDMLYILMAKALEDESLKKTLDFLVNNLEPWALIVRYWKQSREFRLKYEANSSPSLTIAEYTNKYKAIRLAKGYELVSLDFIHLHEDKSDSMDVNWPLFEERITKYINKHKKRITDSIDKELVKELLCKHKKLQEDGKRVLILQLLASLFPAKGKVQIGNKSRKPSIELSRNSLIYHSTVAGQVASIIADRHKVASRFGGTVQPYVLFVDANRWAVDAVYVIIDDFFYKLKTVTEALDVCFKAFFVFNAHYPPESHHLWFLLQKEIYEITTEEDDKQLESKAFIDRLRTL